MTTPTAARWAWRLIDVFVEALAVVVVFLLWTQVPYPYGPLAAVFVLAVDAGLWVWVAIVWHLTRRHRGTR